MTDRAVYTLIKSQVRSSWLPVKALRFVAAWKQGEFSAILTDADSDLEQ